jgi:AraC family transcriptional regulator, positive regulator of tynA and feaB
MAQLEQTWSTEQALPSKALSYWKDIICENLLDLQIDSARKSDFHGQFAKCSLGPLKANFISVSQQRVWRSRHRSGRAQDAIFHLIHVRRGFQFAEHCGKSLKLEQGDCLMVDCLAGFKFDFPEGVDALVLEIRKDWIRGWLPVPEEAAGQIFGREPGWGATLSSALGNLMPSTIGDICVPHSAVAEQIAVLLALATTPATPSLTTHKRGLLKRVSQTLRDRCHEQDLDPSAVASSLGLSRRYIHVLFAAAGTTFSHELYGCRLQRAERLLRDRRYDGVGIAEIAWNCGFSEPSHFTRRFRESFGLPPTAYRQRLLS